MLTPSLKSAYTKLPPLNKEGNHFQHTFIIEFLNIFSNQIESVWLLYTEFLSHSITHSLNHSLKK